MLSTFLYSRSSFLQNDPSLIIKKQNIIIFLKD